jgi:hypothetical protein
MMLCAFILIEQYCLTRMWVSSISRYLLQYCVAFTFLNDGGQLCRLVVRCHTLMLIIIVCISWFILHFLFWIFYATSDDISVDDKFGSLSREYLYIFVLIAFN